MKKVYRSGSQFYFRSLNETKFVSPIIVMSSMMAKAENVGRVFSAFKKSPSIVKSKQSSEGEMKMLFFLKLSSSGASRTVP